MSSFCQKRALWHRNSPNCLSAFLLAQGVFQHNSDCRVYTPQGNADAAVIQLSDMQAEHSQPDSFVIMTGDFSKANPKNEMLKFIRQVPCATRDGRTLDHCYTTIKGAYRSIPRPPLSRSDHTMVYLVPTYKQQLKCFMPAAKTVKQWLQWRHFAAALNALIGECSKKPQPTFTNTQTQSAITSPSARASAFQRKQSQATPTTNHGSILISNTSYRRNKMRTKTKTIQESEICSGKGHKDRQGQIPWQAWENLTTNNSKNIWHGLKAITNYKPSPKNTIAPTLIFLTDWMTCIAGLINWTLHLLPL